MEPATFRRILDLRLKDRPPSGEGMSIWVTLKSGNELSGRLKKASSTDVFTIWDGSTEHIVEMSEVAVLSFKPDA